VWQLWEYLKIYQHCYRFVIERAALLATSCVKSAPEGALGAPLGKFKRLFRQQQRKTHAEYLTFSLSSSSLCGENKLKILQRKIIKSLNARTIKKHNVHRRLTRL